jgi:transposase
MATYVGIDVGKQALEIAVEGEARVHHLPNSPLGWMTLAGLLQAVAQPRIVLEATNRYHEGVTASLQAQSTPVTVANPMQTATFRRSEGKLAKTDAIDAKSLQRFGSQKQPAPTPPADPAQRKVRDLSRTRTDLVGARSRFRQQIETAPDGIQAAYGRAIAGMTQQIAAIDADLRTAIRVSPALARIQEVLQSMPGVGPTISAVLLAELPELGCLGRRQIASLGGLAPRDHRSGKMTKRKLVWGGRPAIRRTMYLAALTATQPRQGHPCATGAEPIRARYDALLARGKSRKQALTAIARWLLTILNVMVREGLRWEQTRAAQGGAVA